MFKTEKCFDSCFTVWEERQGHTQGTYLRQAPESRSQKLGPTFPVSSSTYRTWTLNHGNCKLKPITKRGKKCFARKKLCVILYIQTGIRSILFVIQTIAGETKPISSYTGAFLNELILSGFQLAPECTVDSVKTFLITISYHSEHLLWSLSYHNDCYGNSLSKA